MAKYLILIFLFPLLSWAQTFNCHLNLGKPGSVVPRSQVDDFIKEFEFDSSQKAGRKVFFKKIEVLMLGQHQNVIVKIIDQEQELEVSTFYNRSQKEIRMILSKNRELYCMESNEWAKQKNEGVKSLLHQKLDSGNLSTFGENLIFKTKAPLIFKFDQKNITQGMRSIIFQDGYVYTADHVVDYEKPWCIFTIQIKRDENTTIQKYTKFEPKSYKEYSNNETHTVHSYSFVDASSGKKGLETNRWAAFSLECMVRKGHPFTLQKFNHITGHRFEIEKK